VPSVIRFAREGGEGESGRWVGGPRFVSRMLESGCWAAMGAVRVVGDAIFERGWVW
jgi:hypothetical protein